MNIKIHSIVDVITNSSSVTYVIASEGSIRTIKGLIDNLLSFCRSGYKADDLFSFNLYSEARIEKRRDNIAKELDEWSKEAVNAKYKEYEESQEKPDWWENDSDDYESVNIVAKEKLDDGNLKTVSEILSDLHNLFGYESSYDG